MIIYICMYCTVFYKEVNRNYLQDNWACGMRIIDKSSNLQVKLRDKYSKVFDIQVLECFGITTDYQGSK